MILVVPEFGSVVILWRGRYQGRERLYQKTVMGQKRIPGQREDKAHGNGKCSLHSLFRRLCPLFARGIGQFQMLIW